MNIKKASQKSDIPTKIVKFNAELFGNYNYVKTSIIAFRRLSFLVY